ncbi:hypothetical protein Tco_0455502 [Tanacetum coccineum]
MAMVRAAFGFCLKTGVQVRWLAYLYAKFLRLASRQDFEMVASFLSFSPGTCLGVFIKIHPNENQISCARQYLHISYIKLWQLRVLCKGYVLKYRVLFDHNVIPDDKRLSAGIGNLIQEDESFSKQKIWSADDNDDNVIPEDKRLSADINRILEDKA